jgi:hypothetical protein
MIAACPVGKRTIGVLTLLLAVGLVPLCGEVVRPAPNFTWQGAGGTKTLRNLQGQPVVLVVAETARARNFRKQLDELRRIYQEFASRGVVFVAALADGSSDVPSDIPFVVANGGAEIAATYGLREKFGIFVIGKDGNLDLATSRVQTGMRIRDIVQNSYQVQATNRREVPRGAPPGITPR